jgi:hypothetical protein
LEYLAAPRAWRYSNGAGTVVGVIDTGIDWFHPVLESSLWIHHPEDINENGRFDPWPSTQQRNGVYGDLDGIDNDGNGFVDDVVGYSFVDTTPPALGLGRGPFPYDQNGHGTAVAALIAGRSSGEQGFFGLAYASQVMVLRAFDPTGVGEEDDIAAAIVYAVLNGAHIINCSFGDIVRSMLVARALELAADAGVVVVASSGNSGSDLPHYPSDEQSVLSIGAASATGRPTAFSSYGDRLFLLAPGQDMITASLGGGFQRVSGTSFAAPLVSATVALLRSLRPELTAEQIRTILAESATPQTAPWQPRSGHGVLAPWHALERAFLLGTVRIRAPLHRSRMHSSERALEIEFDVIHPLLERWELIVQSGDSTAVLDSGHTSLERYRRRFDGIATGRSGQLGIRLRAHLRTGKTIDDVVTVEDIREPLRIDSALVRAVWVGSRRQFAVIVLASRPCQIRLDLTDDRGQYAWAHSGDGQYRRLHALLLPPLPGGRYRVLVTAVDQVDTASIQLDSIDANLGPAGSASDWSKKPLVAEALLLSGSAAIGPDRFLATRFSQPQEAVVLERSQDTFRVIASSQRTLFLRGIGDVDGDGSPEVLTYDAGQSRLYRFAPKPFSEVVWADTASRTLWAAGLADITGDGRPEILGFRTQRTARADDGTLMPRSDALVAIGWDGVSFRVLDSIELASSRQGGRQINTITAPLCAVGDFDGDGLVEVAYADGEGDLEIAEWSDGQFRHEYRAPPQPFLAGAGTEFVVAADVDGDGIHEVFYAAPAFPAYNTFGEYEPPLWHTRLVKATGRNAYDIVWDDYVWGVRYGRPYYNGVAAGDLTGDGKADIVAALFPTAYVLTWNGAGLVPLLALDSVWSNGALIADIDGDGRAELALTRGTVAPRTEFRTYTPAAIRAPQIVTAYALQNGDLYCRWVPTDQAERYLLRVEGTILAETVDTAARIPLAALPTCTQCRIEVRSVRASDSSHWSEPAVVVRGQPLALDTALAATEGDSMVRIYVRGMLPRSGVPPRALTIERDSSKWDVELTLASSTTQLLAWLARPLDVGQYRITLAEGTFDGNGNQSPQSTATFVVQPKDVSPAFRVERLLQATPREVVVQFSMQPDPTTLHLDSLRVEPYGAIAGVETSTEPRALRFLLDPTYQYEARGMTYWMRFPMSFRSIDGVPITRGSGNMVAWYYTTETSDSTQAFPQPWSRSRDIELRFSHVPLGARVVITTLGGVEIAHILCTDPAGGVRWIPQLPSGEPLPEGVYLYYVQHSDGSHRTLQKFVVVP